MTVNWSNIYGTLNDNINVLPLSRRWGQHGDLFTRVKLFTRGGGFLLVQSRKKGIDCTFSKHKNSVLKNLADINLTMETVFRVNALSALKRKRLMWYFLMLHC